MIHAFSKIPELVHDLLAGSIILLLLRFEFLLLSALHLRVPLEYDEVPLFLLLLLVASLTLPHLLFFYLSVFLEALVLSCLVLLILQLVDGVTPGEFGEGSEVISLLRHEAHLVLNLPEHLDAVGLILMRHIENVLEDLYDELLQSFDLVKTARSLLLKKN